MSVLDRTIRRDVAGRRVQYLSVTVTVVLGLALFAASYDAFLNLETSYRVTYDRLAFADLTITDGDTERIADDAESRADVEAVTIRRQGDVPIRIDGNHVLLGRIVELPEPGPAVNRVDVLEGAAPDPTDTAAVLTERHLYDHFGMEPGSTIEILVDGEWTPAHVAGSAASPEYLWPARSRQDILTSPDDFGVVFASSAAFDALAGEFDRQVLVRFADDVPAGSGEDVSTAALGAGATLVVPREEQPSHAALSEDLSGFGELSFLFPVLFLGAAGMATYILLGRLVRSQRLAIATLRANGLSARRILAHYVVQGAITTTIAGVIGLVIGVVAGRAVTGFYTDAVSVPDTVTRLHLSTIVIGLVLSVGSGAIAAAAPAIGAMRVEPGVVLRGTPPEGHGGRSIAERVVPPLRRLPARWRMVLRGVGRDHRRALSTAIGVVLALTLILASWGMLDTVDILLDRQFNHVQLQDAQIFPDGSDPDIADAVASAEGVGAVETVVQTGVVISSDGRRYATELVAFEPDTRMHDFGDAELPDDAVLVGSSIEQLLDVSVGDAVTLTRTDGTATTELPIAGFVDEPLGTFVYASNAAIASLDDGHSSSLLVRFDDGVDRAELRADLSALPGVAAYSDARSLYRTAQDMMSLFYAFVGVMLVFGSVMAVALIVNTATVNAAERSPELAAMEVNGTAPGQLGRLLAGESLLLTLLAIVPGLLVGYYVSAGLMDSFSSDLFDFGLELRATTMLWSVLVILVAWTIGQWPAWRTIRSLDVAAVVRERAQ